MSDIVRLVLDDHHRVRRLFEELEGAGDTPEHLAAVWAKLSGVLLAHFDAVEEILSMPLVSVVFGGPLVMRALREDADDVRDAAADTGQRKAGSPQWWLAVRSARVAAYRHISSTEVENLPMFRQRTSERIRQELGQQWTHFMVALSHDKHEETHST